MSALGWFLIVAGIIFAAIIYLGSQVPVPQPFPWKGVGVCMVPVVLGAVMLWWS